MRAGKLPENALHRSVLRQLHSKNQLIVSGACAGEDAAAFWVPYGNRIIVSSDPYTVPAHRVGRYAVLRALNNIAASGGTPFGVTVTVLLPENAREIRLRELMAQIDETCADYGVEVMGGHTQITDAVTRITPQVTALGTAGTGEFTRTTGLSPGMDIVACKWIGMEGTAILAEEKADKLSERFPLHFIEQSKALADEMSIYKAAQIAIGSGATCMHDASEGGIFAALWEMASSSGVGIEIDLKKIPIRQETVEISEYFGINPYRLLSGGCLLTGIGDGENLVKKLNDESINAVVIGRATDGNDRVVTKDDERSFLELPQADEIYNIVIN